MLHYNSNPPHPNSTLKGLCTTHYHCSSDISTTSITMDSFIQLELSSTPLSAMPDGEISNINDLVNQQQNPAGSSSIFAWCVIS